MAHGQKQASEKKRFHPVRSILSFTARRLISASFCQSIRVLSIQDSCWRALASSGRVGKIRANRGGRTSLGWPCIQHFNADTRRNCEVIGQVVIVGCPPPIGVADALPVRRIGSTDTHTNAKVPMSSEQSGSVFHRQTT